jgi:hypothetical protein
MSDWPLLSLRAGLVVPTRESTAALKTRQSSSQQPLHADDSYDCFAVPNPVITPFETLRTPWLNLSAM